MHIDICIISVLYIWFWFPYLCILTSAVFQFCIFDFAFLFSAYWHLHYFSSVYLTFFPRLCILKVALFQFCIFYFAFVVCAYYHLQYFSSVCFTFLSSSPHIGIYIILFFYILLCFSRLCILTSAVFQFCIIYFAFFVFPVWHLQCLGSADFTLLSSSLHIDKCSISVLYISPCFPRLWILASEVFPF